MLYEIKHFFGRIRNIIKWLPVIWKTYDWDYCYSIDVFKFHLKQIQKSLEDDASHEGDKHHASRIKTIIELMDRVYEEYYLFEVLNEYEYQYGKIEVDALSSNWIIFSEYCDRARQRQRRAHKLLWELVEHNIQGWWV